PRWAADRFTLLTVALLLLVTAAAWVGVVRQAGSMEAMNTDGMGMADPMSPPGPLVDAPGLVAFVGSWAGMMAAMMLPSALPMILLYRTAARNQSVRSNPILATWAFVGGYLVVWAAFGAPVYLASRIVDTALAGDMTLAQWASYGVAAVLLA